MNPAGVTAEAGSRQCRGDLSPHMAEEATMSDVNENFRKPRLSDTQLIALSSASQREDGAVSLPDRIKGAAAINLVASLIAKGLVRETCAALGMPVARRDEEGRPFALVITELGRASINVVDETSEDRDQENDDTPESQANAASGERPEASEFTNAGPSPSVAPPKPANAQREDSRSEENANRAASTSTPADMPREGSKLANVISLLDRPDGASLDELIHATTWLPHTTRAALTGLRKRGLNILRRREDGMTRYRIVGAGASDIDASDRVEASASGGPTEGEPKAA
jgi:Protein of unknown function (DUF3489)